MSSGVAHYYDRLHRWNGLADLFGYGGGRRALTVHRPLADPQARGAATTTRLHDLILEYVPATPRVLDAGCGLGGTMFALAPHVGGSYVGVTLSPEQAAVANRVAGERGLSGSVRALVQSYDTPPEGPFDVVIAIESLAHSLAPAVSVAALTSVLAPGGRFIVVDDMPEPAAIESPDLALFKSGWQSPCLWDRESYLKAFRALALDMAADRDLTGDTRPRTLAQIARLEWLNRLAALFPSESFRQVMHSHLGGLALERLTRHGLMRYRLLVGTKR